MCIVASVATTWTELRTCEWKESTGRSLVAFCLHMHGRWQLAQKHQSPSVSLRLAHPTAGVHACCKNSSPDLCWRRRVFLSERSWRHLSGRDFSCLTVRQREGSICMPQLYPQSSQRWHRILQNFLSKIQNLAEKIPILREFITIIQYNNTLYNVW